MPHLDSRTGEVVIRIVYDGAPNAGKTTNLLQLAKRVAMHGGEPAPSAQVAHTEFFDWVDFSSGYFDGHRVRCQLISAPGHHALLHRRRYLLESADALVFVVDACGPLDATAHAFALARSVTQRTPSRGHAPATLVVQANKQDLPGALSPTHLGTALGLPGTARVMGSSAALGSGVIQAFTMALGFATERARALLFAAELSAWRAREDQPEALHNALLAQDRLAERADEGSACSDTTPFSAAQRLTTAQKPKDTP